eukprot:CAMPEP_0168486274 /NCGR_PEP_ID=MMETSP0228-20121227/67038_1 /TAXON_ID=133427 /ORGANISM="Protoceratium reticulatum, Strain CCCM 535 (=CCMP 1889)" /LENGTH=553 /DNA_ID=CAMNT_0008502859 /DNA_START=18 /DNA_END=1679 /DNA_ORIENTATION=-
MGRNDSGVACCTGGPADGRPRTDVSWQLILLGFNAACGGFLFGYDTGSMSAALVQVQRPRAEGLENACPGLADHRLAIWEQALVTSFVVLGAFLSSITAGCLNSAFGRRKVLLFGALCFVFGEALMAIAMSVPSMLVARLIVGLGVGISSHTVPLYISECSPTDYRGTLCFLNDLMNVMGQVTAAIVATLVFMSETRNGWRLILGCGVVPSTLMFVGMYFSPESPRWLLSRKQDREASEVLQVLRTGTNPEEVELEFEQMRQGVAAEREAAPKADQPDTTFRLTSGFKSFHQTYWVDLRVRRALALGCSLQILQQWCGINTIMYFGASVVKMAGSDTPESLSSTAVKQPLIHRMFRHAPQETPIYCFSTECKRDVAFTVILSFSQMAGVIGSFMLVDRIGRRPLVLFSLAGVSVSLMGVGVAFSQVDVSLTAVIFLVALYLLFFGIGMSPVPWTVNAEIYPQAVRASCISISTATNWIMNFVVSETFLGLAAALSSSATDPQGHPNGVFFFYSAIATLGWVHLFFKLPETKGLSLEEIGSLFIQPEEVPIMQS